MIEVKKNIHTVDACMNDSEIAFVFSCPGKKEEETGKLCSGKTGENLEILINKLHNIKPEVFVGYSKEDYFITNASKRVHYKKLTGDTEPRMNELRMSDNICRLTNELKNRKIIICCGLISTKIVEELNLDALILEVCHLGTRGLARKYPYLNNTEVRLNKVSEKILKSIKEEKLINRKVLKGGMYNG